MLFLLSLVSSLIYTQVRASPAIPLIYIQFTGQLAAIHGHDELIELLVHLGVDVNLRNNQGMTALHMAAQLGLLKVL